MVQEKRKQKADMIIMRLLTTGKEVMLQMLARKAKDQTGDQLNGYGLTVSSNWQMSMKIDME